MRNFDTLSVFVECSTGCVPRISYLKDFAALIAKMGYNAMYLGTSDTLKIEGESYFGYLRGGYTREEIKELDAFCKTVGIELRPAVQTLAKFARLGAYDDYKDLMDIGDILQMFDTGKNEELTVRKALNDMATPKEVIEYIESCYERVGARL